jgi:CubicO group peptidase (beta-lactamase class C family)
MNQHDSRDLAREIDVLLREAYPPHEPGAAVIVVKDGTTVLRAGYGMANVELDVAIEPHRVFRLGSITKQFTAVATLLLLEDGKLALEDDITRFLPTYPTQGHHITVEHLLTHTSGIKSYTSMPEWQAQWRKDLPLTELIDLFRDQPMEFAPGARWAYNNSAYVLLGAIIEHVAGQSYEEFLQRRIFEPLEMAHTAYDHTERVVPGRVAGYERGPDGLRNAAYLSMTHPHAAGALISSVDDLARWDAALYTDRLLPQRTLQRAWTSSRISDGTETGYGYGWMIASFNGYRLIEHAGGINGFVTNAVRVPEERLYVAILNNVLPPKSLPTVVSLKIVGLALGCPYREPAPVTLGAPQLDALVGTYRSESDEWMISREGDALIAQPARGMRTVLVALSPTEFYPNDDPFTRIHFSVAADGTAAALEQHTRFPLVERAVRVR